MASVRLSVAETQEKALPPVCIHCGMPARDYRAQTYCWVPGSTWLFVPLLGHFGHIAAMQMKTEMRVWVPLCEEHRTHGIQADRRNARRLLLVVAASALLFGLGVVVAVVMHRTGQVARLEANTIGMFSFFGAGAFGLVGMLAVLGLGQLQSIRPTAITEDAITLAGVAEVFAQAVVERRPASTADFT
jgi:hypothetical protein